MNRDTTVDIKGPPTSLVKILFVFIKIGAFTFGGGYAILPMIQREIVQRWGWVDSESFMDILVIAQSLPGPFALNCSIIVGRKLWGTRGGLTAALGIVLPSFVIILLLAVFFIPVVRDNRLVQAIFYGLRPAVVALIAAVAWDLGKKILKDGLRLGLFVLLLVFSLVFHPHPLFILALGALLGTLLFYKGKQAEKES